jgi:hypothetical protein
MNPEMTDDSGSRAARCRHGRQVQPAFHGANVDGERDRL